MQHHAEKLVHFFARKLGYRHAVDLYFAAADLVKAHQQIDHRGLASAGRADYRDLLTGANLRRKVVDYDLIGRIGIAEMDVLEAYFAANFGQLGGLFAFVSHLFAFEKVENAVRRSGSRLHIRHALRYLRERGGEKADVENERNYHAELYRAVHREDRADHADRNVSNVADDVHERLHNARKELRTPVSVVDRGVQAIEMREHLALSAADADDLVTRVHFFNEAVQLAQTFLARREKALRARHYQHHQSHADERYRQRDERQPPLGREHHDKAANELRCRADYGRQTVCQTLLECGNVVSHAAEYVALRVGVKIFLRHAVDLFRKLAAHTVGHFQRYHRHDVMLNEAEKRAEQVYRREENAYLRDLAEVDAAEQTV